MTNEAGTHKSSIDETTLALGKLSKALETVERARGRLYDFHQRLYDFHQMSGEADFQLGMAVVALREAGHTEQANRLDRLLIGRNVLHGRWTFQIVEEYDTGYYASSSSWSSRQPTTSAAASTRTRPRSSGSTPPPACPATSWSRDSGAIAGGDVLLQRVSVSRALTTSGNRPAREA